MSTHCTTRHARARGTLAALLAAALWGCGGDDSGGAARVLSPVTPTAADGGLSHDEEPPPPPLGGRVVTAYRDGRSVETTEPQAVADGLTVIDLSNYWVPFLFSEQDTPSAPRLKNEFRPIFRKLANNWFYESRTQAAARESVERRIARAREASIAELKAQGLSDAEIAKELGLDAADAGAAEVEAPDAGDLPESGVGEEDHFLEVYGIPPSLSVLRHRAIEEVERPCYEDVDFDRIRRYEGSTAYRSNEAAKEEAQKGKLFARQMRQAMEKLGAADPEALLANPANKLSGGLVSIAIRYEALVEAQKQLACEGLFPPNASHYTTGGLDWKTQMALSAFERKNRIFAWGIFGEETAIALAKTPKERLFDAFLRVVAERIADAAGVIEDGTARAADGGPAMYKDEKGVEREVPNLVAEYTALLLKHMDIGTPDKVEAFLEAHGDAALDKLFVAIPLPPRPPYYGPTMDLHSVIDRGDVWYDFPVAPDGRDRVFPRKNMPTNTLLVRWNGQDIPLVTMNTTIGSWRTELATDGYEYYKYKESDVGPRVWKDIVAGPVWLPPDTTPATDLVKPFMYKGRTVMVPNYDEFGPWYASAYGLVAAFHVRPVPRKNGTTDYFDNGIRSHGSVDYNSILRRYSHGCHRLYNHLAIRMFDFVLKHRPYTRVGQMPGGYGKKVEIEEDTFEISLDTRGYKYELVAPLDVEVLRGRVRGKQRAPIETYMPKPGVEYGSDAQFLPPGYKPFASGDAGP
jgi:hypothetical protein